MDDQSAASAISPEERRRRYLVYASVLFTAAVATVVVLGVALGPGGTAVDWRVAGFLLVYGLFTITTGYPHPTFGHVSFDRVAQLASILIVGPYAAAWINGLASFLWPWHRLKLDVPLVEVVTAALNNSGLMVFVILAGGYLYTGLGGQVPLMTLDLRSLGLLLAVLLVMQLVNDLGMMIVFYLAKDDPSKVFGFFSTLVELAAGLIAVLVAIVFNRMELPVFVLLLTVLSLGMLVHRQFAHIRQRLESIVEDRTRELKAKSLELERQATQDKLTGLYNRRYADAFLDREIENARRYEHDLSIALADVDHFKAINDRYSHAKGDQVLRRVSAILTDRCRKTDMIARYGGEEFLLCFPETSRSRAGRLCEELRAAVESEDFSEVGPDLVVTLSFGLAEAHGDASRKTLLADADEKLYDAKRAGRNRIAS